MSKKLTSHRAKWAPQEISAVRQMSEMGMSSKEIGKLLGRTPNAVAYQKSVFRISQNKDAKFTGLRITSESVAVKPKAEAVPELKNPMRDPAKAITRIARQIARENGKRITMAMFFVEDLV